MHRVSWQVNTMWCAQELFVSPVIAADGHTYEMGAIMEWLQGSSKSPVTGKHLPHTMLLPNLVISCVIYDEL